MSSLKHCAIAAAVVIWGVVFYDQAHAVTLDPYTDYAMTGVVLRNPDGTTKRDSKVISAYRKLYACPSTHKFTGACPGWALDHTRSLDCGGIDAVWNLTWMDNRIKSCAGDYCKDRYERVIYGGKGISKGCP